jgi:hypothetical protein
MSPPDKSSKLEMDYEAYVKRVEETASANLEKIRLDLNVLKERAAQYGSAA